MLGVDLNRTVGIVEDEGAPTTDGDGPAAQDLRSIDRERGPFGDGDISIDVGRHRHPDADLIRT